MRGWWIVAAGLAAATWPGPRAAAQVARPGPALVAADLRPGTSLAGSWHYSIDPYRAGLIDFHGQPPPGERAALCRNRCGRGAAQRPGPVRI